MSPRLISIFKDLNVVLLLSYFHEKYAVVPADNPTNTIVFVCKLHYIHCLITEVSILTVQFATLHIPWSHIRKRTSRSAIGLGLYAPWDFQSNTRTRLLDTFLSYVSFTNSDILLGLSNNPRNLFLNYQHLFCHCYHISQLRGYYRACGSCHAFLDRGLLIPRKLLPTVSIA